MISTLTSSRFSKTTTAAVRALSSSAFNTRHFLLANPPTFVSLLPRPSFFGSFIAYYAIKGFFAFLADDFASSALNGGVRGGSALDFPRSSQRYYPDEFLTGTEAAAKTMLESLPGITNGTENAEYMSAELLQFLRNSAEDGALESVQVHNIVSSNVSSVRVVWGPEIKTNKPSLAYSNMAGYTKLYQLGPKHYLTSIMNLCWIYPRLDLEDRKKTLFTLSIEASSKGATLTIDAEVSLDLELTFNDHPTSLRNKFQNVILSFQSNHFRVSDLETREGLDEVNWTLVDVNFALEKRRLAIEDKAQRSSSEEHD